MKTIIYALLASATLLPFSAFAQQTTQPVTRAEVRSELAQLEAVGYRPSTHDADYPASLMKAEAKVASMNKQNVDYGGAASGLEAGGALNPAQTSAQ